MVSGFLARQTKGVGLSGKVSRGSASVRRRVSDIKPHASKDLIARALDPLGKRFNHDEEFEHARSVETRCREPGSVYFATRLRLYL